MIWDPLRRKEVAETPEEKVRQWFIGVLSAAGVPAGLMMSEVSMKFGDKTYRADILIYDRSGSPLAVVECKRPTVRVDGRTASQALRYHATLDVRYIMLTNGNNTYIYRREGDGFSSCASLPSYEEMLCQQ